MKIKSFLSRRVMGSLSLSGLLAVALIACTQQSGPASDRDTAGTPGAWPKAASPFISDSVEQQVEALLGRMSLEEKVGQIMQAEIQSITPDEVRQYHIGSVLNGGGSLPNRIKNAKADDWLALADAYYDASMDRRDGGVAIPIIWGTDAVHGHNNVTGATLFPHNIGLGATRNPGLVRKIGEATAKEVRATGIEWVFAPTLAVARNDQWGRTYESWSEDPELVKIYSKAMVEGLQGAATGRDFMAPHRVVATAKHFIADGGTRSGDDQGNAVLDEQTLIDIHNAGYPAAINAGVLSIMASFSSWNGEKLHGHRYLLTDVLKQQMGFQGLVVGDWNGHGQVPGCSNASCPQAINAGIDLLMVTSDWKAMIDNTLAQVKAGEISEERLDDAVRRILRVKVLAGLFTAKPSERPLAGDQQLIGHPDHRALARQAVRESLVLLKNKNRVLPIRPQSRVLVAGDGADNIGKQSGGWSVSWQGTGNTNSDFPGATSIYAGIRAAVESGGGQVQLSVDGDYRQKPDVAIVVFGEDPYAEGQGDIDSLEFEPVEKKSLALLKKLKAQGVPVVSVFLSGRPLWVNPEINASDAFVAAWLPGSEGAGIADLLIAKADGQPNYDFKGTLGFSWPALPGQAELNIYQPGYSPLFPFGYGLTYASGQSGPSNLAESVKGVATGTSGDIHFYQGRPLQPWNVFFNNHERKQILSGAYAALPDGSVKLQTRDKDLQEDALTFTWQSTPFASLTLEDGRPLDLREQVQQGVVAFDLLVTRFENAGLEVRMKCDEDCERKVSLRDYANAHVGKGWQQVRIPLSCFYREGDDFSRVVMPFSLNTGGVGEIAVANITFYKKAEGNIACPDYRTASVTPAPLAEYWATSWWMPRHQSVLERIAQGNVDLIMIGDSITQGWEKEGKAVWDRFYANRQAVNMGFSGDRTENVLWRLHNGEVDGIAPRVAVVMIGTNNTGHRQEAASTTAKGIRAILDELRSRLPDTRILLLGVFPREEQPDALLREINNGVNGIIRHYADNRHIFYLDVGPVFLQKDQVLPRSIMPDLLHLNETGYQRWAEAMEPLLSELLAR